MMEKTFKASQQPEHLNYKNLIVLDYKGLGQNFI